jgi:3-methyladenine DNA glycosylase AlkD
MIKAPGIDVQSEIDRFTAAFRQEGDPERAQGQKAYMKSDRDFFGVRAPFIRGQAKRFKLRHPEIATAALFTMVEALWATTYHDLRSLGIALLELYIKQLSIGEMDQIESLLRRSSNWDHVDYLSTKISASIVARDQKTKPILKRWAADDHFWLRRAAMLSLMPELRAGGGDFELFCRFAATMIEEKEFFIRKAIGWVLREVSKKRPELVYPFLSRNIDLVSGLTLREGAKYLPEAQREELLRRYRNRGSR